MSVVVRAVEEAVGRGMTDVLAPAVNFNQAIRGGMISAGEGLRWFNEAKLSAIERWTSLDLAADGDAARLRSEILQHVHSENNPEKMLKSLQKVINGRTGIETVDEQIQGLLPHGSYFEERLPRVQRLTHELTGFTDEPNFKNFVEATHEQGNSPRLQRVYERMSQWVKKNPFTLLKYVVATGGGAAFLSALKHYQKLNTGCFVYSEGGRRREKIQDRSCQSSDDTPPSPQPHHHPLDGVSWDCDYDVSPLEPHDPAGYLQAGCKGICDPAHYNTLAQFTTDYNPVDPTTLDHTFLYRCERGTLMQSMAQELGDTLHEVIRGFGDSGLAGDVARLGKVARSVMLVLVAILLATWLLPYIQRRRRHGSVASVAAGVAK